MKRDLLRKLRRMSPHEVRARARYVFTQFGEEAGHLFASHSLECGFQGLSRSSHDGHYLHAGAARGLADLRHIRLRKRIAIIGEHADATCSW